MNASSTPRAKSNEMRRLAIVIGPIAAALTLIGTAQELMRRGPGLTAPDLLRSLSLNALDWFAWALLTPIMVQVARRWRVDDAVRRSRSIAVWIVLGLALCLTHSVFTGIVVRQFGLVPRQVVLQPLLRFAVFWATATILLNMLIFVMIAGVLHAAFYQRDLRERRAREVLLEARLAQSELNVLRMQLQPHFFFNALHTISSLMITDVATAQAVVASLGDIIRSSIDHTATQEVTLREELAFVERYIGIQRARFRSRLAFEVEVDPELLDAIVPSLVLQPLVENAIRHGIEQRATAGSIVIHAKRADDSLRLRVLNSGPDVVKHRYTGIPTSDANGTSNGIGLANIRARLSQMYGDNQRFVTQTLPDGGFEVELRIPLRTRGLNAPRAFAAVP
ncbi:MAG: sensor histidine kinase [Gemmatimonadaceae bacterium]